MAKTRNVIFPVLQPALEEEIGRIPEFELLNVSSVRDGVYEPQPDFRAVVEKGRNKAIAVVSDKYALVQMREIFSRVLSSLDQEVEGNVLYYGGRGQLHLFPKGSNVGICVMNSVDSSSAIKIFFIGRVDGTTVYVSRPEIAEYKRLHVGMPLVSVQNFSEILARAQETWQVIVDRLSNIPLTDEIVAEVKEAVDTKKLSELVDAFAKNNIGKYIGQRPTLWDLLLTVLKAASESKFKSDIHREKRLRQLSGILLAFALKES
jgi:hypothetical protein